jgi:hypothetical protein
MSIGKDQLEQIIDELHTCLEISGGLFGSMWTRFHKRKQAQPIGASPVTNCSTAGTILK